MSGYGYVKRGKPKDKKKAKPEKESKKPEGGCPMCGKPTKGEAFCPSCGYLLPSETVAP
jgi:hypothetical protein